MRKILDGIKKICLILRSDAKQRVSKDARALIQSSVAPW
jgi:hypothetical protein